MYIVSFNSDSLHVTLRSREELPGCQRAGVFNRGQRAPKFSCGYVFLGWRLLALNKHSRVENINADHSFIQPYPQGDLVRWFAVSVVLKP